MTDLACTKHKPVFSHTPGEVYGHLIYNKIVLRRKCVINGVYAIINRLVYFPRNAGTFALAHQGKDVLFNNAVHVRYYLSETMRGCDHNRRNNNHLRDSYLERKHQHVCLSFYSRI